MNLLDAEDMIKGLPDQALMQQAQMPTGEIPQFLVISEIKNRADMRKRYEAQLKEQPQGTVAEQVMREGIAGMMPQQGVTPQMGQQPPQGGPQMPQQGMPPQGGPQGMPPQGMPPQGMPPQMPPQGGPQGMPPQMPPQGMPPQGMPPGMPPMGMAAGGIVRMQGGGVAKIQKLMDILAVGGVTAPDLIAQGYTVAEIDAAQNQLRERMSMPVAGMSSVPTMGAIADPVRPPQVGYGDQYDPPVIPPDVTDFVSDKASEVADAVGRGIEPFRIEGQKQMPNYGLLGRNDLSLPSLSMPDRMSQAEMAERFSPEEVSERLANRPSLADDLDMTPMDFFRQRVLGQDPEEPSQAADLFGTGFGAPTKPGTEPAAPIDALIEEAQQANTDSSAKGLEKTGPPLQGTNNRAVQGTGSSATLSLIDEMMADLRGRETQASPTLDLSDILARSKKMTDANILMQLGSGIAGGDVAKGIEKAGMAGVQGAQEAAKIEMAQRIAQTKAGQEDIRRGEQRDLDVAKLEIARERIKSELDRSDGLNQRAVLGYYSDMGTQLRKKATTLAGIGEELSPEEKAYLTAIDELMGNYSAQYGIALPEIEPTEDPLSLGTPPPPAGA